MLLACKAPEPPPPVNVVLRITTTRGTPVSGAEVRLKNEVVGRSDEKGAVRVELGGREGDTFELAVHCPAPLRSPADPIVARRFEIRGGDAEQTVKCQETRRTLVVVVRAENGPNLPILYLGKEIGRTDRSGAAHVKIDADVHERVELTLSTAGEEWAGVHPQNPIAAFEPGENDDVREFAVTFTRDAKKKPPAPPATGPTVF